MLGGIEPHQVDENNTNETLPCGGWYVTQWMKMTDETLPCEAWYVT